MFPWAFFSELINYRLTGLCEKISFYRGQTGTLIKEDFVLLSSPFVREVLLLKKLFLIVLGIFFFVLDSN